MEFENGGRQKAKLKIVYGRKKGFKISSYQVMTSIIFVLIFFNSFKRYVKINLYTFRSEKSTIKCNDTVYVNKYK